MKRLKPSDFLDAASISFLENNRPGGLDWFESVINNPSFKEVLRYYKITDYHCTDPEKNGTHVIFLKKKFLKKNEPYHIVPSTLGIYIDDALDSMDPEIKGTYVRDGIHLIIYQPWVIQ